MNPEEFMDYVKKGWKIYKFGEDRYRFYDPVARKYMLIDKSLNELAKYYYIKQKEEEEKKEEKKTEQIQNIQSNPIQSNDEVNRRDMELFLRLMSGKIDPKAPILTQMIQDVAWFENVKRAVGVYSMAEFWPEKSEDVDLANPGNTVQNIVKRIKAVKEVASKAAEMEGRLKAVEEEYMSKIKSLEEENAKLKKLSEDLGKLYDKAVDTAIEKIEDLRRRVEETLNLILKVIPPMLTKDDRVKYMNVVYPKIRTLWGGGNV
jgi:hypothetical protein